MIHTNAATICFKCFNCFHLMLQQVVPVLCCLARDEPGPADEGARLAGGARKRGHWQPSDGGAAIRGVLGRARGACEDVHDGLRGEPGACGAPKG
jgi:hypothetical protein